MAATLSAAGRPNLVFIMADDMGRDWVGCYGARHATPNLDRLAAEGLRFNNVWCAPLCTPTRVMLLTGLYPFHTGWTRHYDVPRWGGKGFDWDRFTCWARLLREAGYATAIGGKWQVNDFRDHPDALARHGFEEHCVWTGYETGNAPPSDRRYWDAYLMTNGKRATHTGAFGPDVINDFLIDFIRRHREGPFCVYYPMLLTHGPHDPTPFNKDDPAWKDKRKGGAYGGQVTYVDYLVGRLIGTIDELGLKQDTLIIFAGDNGSSAAGMLHGRPYPSGKGKLANRGANVPFLVRAPFLIGGRAGQASNDLIDFTDLFPTLLEVAGVKPPAGLKLDGRSFVGLLDGSARPEAKRSWIASELGGRMVRDQRYLLDGKGRFYDLEADPLQEHDLSGDTRSDLVGARARLQGVLDSFPPDAGPPFPEFGRR